MADEGEKKEQEAKRSVPTYPLIRVFAAGYKNLVFLA